tara:strand:+ start:240 stop:1325 length:1086 start_codon:yes stop_codon:yes gene_type:complete
LNDSNIALLIDYENVGIDSLQSLVERLSGMGRIIVKRAYADWSTQRKGQERLIELGVEAIHNYRTSRSGKNSCDIKLTIDAVELLHSTQIDTFALVSSDSDFVPLVNHLRGSGKYVVGAGRKAVTATTMVKSCDQYIFLDTDTHQTKTPYASPKRNGNTKNSKRENTVSQNSASDSDVAGTLLVRAVEASMDDDGNALGTKLAQTMMRIDPSFNYKTMGYRSFRDFLTSKNEVDVTFREGTDFTVSVKSTETDNKGRKNIHPNPSVPKVSPKIIEARSESDTSKQSENGSDIDWAIEINAAWSKRNSDNISVQAAASIAARILGFKRLRDSSYSTLDKLISSSETLEANWSRNKNSVVRNS